MQNEVLEKILINNSLSLEEYFDLRSKGRISLQENEIKSLRQKRIDSLRAYVNYHGQIEERQLYVNLHIDQFDKDGRKIGTIIQRRSTLNSVHEEGRTSDQIFHIECKDGNYIASGEYKTCDEKGIGLLEDHACLKAQIVNVQGKDIVRLSLGDNYGWL